MYGVARAAAQLPLVGLLWCLVVWGRLVHRLDGRHEPPAMTVNRGRAHVRPGNLGEPRHLKLLLAMLICVAVPLLGSMVAELAAAGRDGALVWGGAAGVLWFSVSLPGVDALRFSGPDGGL